MTFIFVSLMQQLPIFLPWHIVLEMLYSLKAYFVVIASKNNIDLRTSIKQYYTIRNTATILTKFDYTIYFPSLSSKFPNSTSITHHTLTFQDGGLLFGNPSADPEVEIRSHNRSLPCHGYKYCFIDVLRFVIFWCNNNDRCL